MTGRVLITLVVVVAIAGCARVSESRFNPFNWFGRSERVATAVAAPGPGVPQANLVAQVTTLRVEKSPGGAIIRATGLPPRQGYYDGELVLLTGTSAESGTLTYQFAISAPREDTRVSTTRSREVVVGLFVSSQKLEGVRAVKVLAATNALAVRR